MFKTDVERRVARKFDKIDMITKNSFSLIREDIGGVQDSLEAVKKYLRNKEKQDKYAKNQDNRLRAEFRKDVEDFTQKIKQLNLALERTKDIEKNVVLKKDLAQIEDSIRNDFRGIIEEFKGQVKECEKRLKFVEKGKLAEMKKKKGFWFFRKKE